MFIIRRLSIRGISLYILFLIASILLAIGLSMFYVGSSFYKYQIVNAKIVNYYKAMIVWNNEIVDYCSLIIESHDKYTRSEYIDMFYRIGSTQTLYYNNKYNLCRTSNELAEVSFSGFQYILVSLSIYMQVLCVYLMGNY